MRIGLNLCTLRGRGSRTIGQGVLSGLLRIGSGHAFDAWIPREWGDQGVAGPRLHFCKSGKGEKFRVENHSIRRAAADGSIERLLSLTDTSVVGCKAPHLLMVQQAYLAASPSEWPRGTSFAFRARMAWMHGYFAAGKNTMSSFTVQTEAMKSRLAKKWHIPKNKIFVVPSAVQIDAEKFKTETLENEEPYICYVATASPQKRYDILPAIMAELKSRGHQPKCRITVTPVMVPGMVESARRLGVLDRFEFLGTIGKNAALSLIAGARAMIMPSVLESFGLPYYEAMALGCPVVAADLDFAREALNEVGFYAPKDSAEGFADRLAQILDSDSKREKLFRRGRRRFEEIRVTWEDVARQYLDILEGL